MNNVKDLDGVESAEAIHSLHHDYMRTTGVIPEAAMEVVSRAQNLKDSAMDYCRENPIKVTAVSLGLGAVAGFALVKLFSRRQSKTEQIIAQLFRAGEETLNHMKSGLKPIVRNIKESMGDN